MEKRQDDNITNHALPINVLQLFRSNPLHFAEMYNVFFQHSGKGEYDQYDSQPWINTLHVLPRNDVFTISHQVSEAPYLQL